jgi:hypothetical protein
MCVHNFCTYGVWDEQKLFLLSFKSAVQLLSIKAPGASTKLNRLILLWKKVIIKKIAD